MCICNAAEPGKTRSSMSSPPQHCRRCHHHCRSHCRRRNTPQPLCVSTLHRLPATSPTATTSDPSEYPSPPSLPLPPFYLASILAPATLPCHASDVIHMRAEPAELHFVSSQSSTLTTATFDAPCLPARTLERLHALIICLCLHVLVMCESVRGEISLGVPSE